MGMEMKERKREKWEKMETKDSFEKRGNVFT